MWICKRNEATAEEKKQAEISFNALSWLNNKKIPVKNRFLSRHIVMWIILHREQRNARAQSGNKEQTEKPN